MIILPKASGDGIKVDTTTPTFAWADLTGNLTVDESGANAATLAVYRGGSIREYRYSAGDKNDLRFHLPHDYEEGTDIVPHIHWFPTTSATYTGTWTMVFTGWLNVTPGTAKSSALTRTLAFNSAMTAGQVQSGDFNTTITGVNRLISSCATITLKLALSSGTGCALIGFDGHYKKNSLGSRAITVK